MDRIKTQFKVFNIIMIFYLIYMVCNFIWL